MNQSWFYWNITFVTESILLPAFPPKLPISWIMVIKFSTSRSFIAPLKIRFHPYWLQTWFIWLWDWAYIVEIRKSEFQTTFTNPVVLPKSCCTSISHCNHHIFPKSFHRFLVLFSYTAYISTCQFFSDPLAFYFIFMISEISPKCHIFIVVPP